MNISPCIKLCKINNEGFCIGCQRTLQEISNWSNLSENDKIKIIKMLEERKKIKKIDL